MLSSFSSHHCCTAFIIFLLFYMTFEQGHQSRLREPLITSPLSWLGSQKGREQVGNCRKQNGSETIMCGLMTNNQLCTLNVSEEGEEKHQGKANSETDTSSPVMSTVLLKAASKTNKKQVPQVSSLTTWCHNNVLLQNTVYLLDYISCLFCLQKTLVTISNTLADRDTFARFPPPITSPHLWP